MVLIYFFLVNMFDELVDELIGKYKVMVRYIDKILGEMIVVLEVVNKRENIVIIWIIDNGMSWGLIGNYKGQVVDGGKLKIIEVGIVFLFIVSWLVKFKFN